MIRGLILGAVAVGASLFAASLLRTETPASNGGAPRAGAGGGCRARTRSGAPCSRPAEPGSDYCWQHR